MTAKKGAKCQMFNDIWVAGLKNVDMMRTMFIAAFSKKRLLGMPNSPLGSYPK